VHCSCKGWQGEVKLTTEESGYPRILTENHVVALSPVEPDHRLSYGSEPEQFGDLYLPPQPVLHPVLILLHGGCWRARYGLGYLGQLCAAFRNEGVAVWNLEYRRLGNGGGWPTTFEDVAAGADFLRGIAERFALDLSRVVVAGHSAGGHLALWLAGRHKLPETSPLFSAVALPVRGVVSLAGIPDLADGVKSGICSQACRELLAGLPDEAPDRYRQASPAELLPLGVPQWHLVGLLDRDVPVDYLQRYAAMAGQQDEVHLELLPDVGHYELILPSSSAWSAVRKAVLTLL
jgi:acetyl esterase/lipase